MKKSTALARISELKLISEKTNKNDLENIIQLEVISLLLDYLDDIDLRMAVDSLVF